MSFVSNKKFWLEEQKEKYSSKTALMLYDSNVSFEELYEKSISFSFSLKENEDVSWTANQSFKIKIDDVAEFEVKSGSEDVKVMKEELEEMQSEYQELVAPFGTEELEDLKGLLTTKDSKENEFNRIKGELKKKSDKPLDKLQKEIIEFKNKIKLKWSKISDDSPYKDCEGKDKSILRDELSSKIVELEDKIQTLTKNRNSVDELLKVDRKNSNELESRLNDLKKDSHGKKQIIEEIKRRIERLEDDGFSREEREKELNKLSVD
ncbi:MAG: hypothetical protein GYA14_09150, partial [Ignavibacteria bacterium]|nr:hypothetical protein [Ignavibacteria bacterium]